MSDGAGDELAKTKLYIELWKQTIDVQKHFNDIELRIRGLALTVLTFTLGAAAVAIKDGTQVRLLGHEFHLSAIVLVIGAVLWLIFYFVDQVWYHRLLIGSVKHGTALEKEIATQLPVAGLTQEISKSSPYKMFGWNIHSTAKLRIFYLLVTLVLVLFAWAAQSAGAPTPAKKATPVTGIGSTPSR